MHGRSGVSRLSAAEVASIIPGERDAHCKRITARKARSQAEQIHKEEQDHGGEEEVAGCSNGRSIGGQYGEERAV